MTRFSFRSALTALALGVAVLGGSALTSGDASAKGMHGGGFHGKFHGGGFHGRWHGGGYRYWGPRYVGLVGMSYGGCVVKRVIDEDGDIILRKICY